MTQKPILAAGSAALAIATILLVPALAQRSPTPPAAKGTAVFDPSKLPDQEIEESSQNPDSDTRSLDPLISRPTSAQGSRRSCGVASAPSLLPSSSVSLSVGSLPSRNSSSSVDPSLSVSLAAPLAVLP